MCLKSQKFVMTIKSFDSSEKQDWQKYQRTSVDCPMCGLDVIPFDIQENVLTSKKHDDRAQKEFCECLENGWTNVGTSK